MLSLICFLFASSFFPVLPGEGDEVRDRQNLEQIMELKQTNPDSALLFLRNIDIEDFSKNEKASLYLIWAQLEFSNMKIEQAKGLYSKGLKWAGLNKDTVLLAEYNYNLALLHYRMDEYRLALEYLQEAELSARFLGDQKHLAKTLSLECAVHSLLGAYDKALKACNLAITILESQDKDYVLIETYISQGEVYLQMRNWMRAKELFQLARELSEALDDKESLSASLSSLGDVAIELSQYVEAEEYYLQSLELDSISGDMYNRAYGFFNLGRLAFRMQEFDSSLEYLQKAIRNADRFENLDLLAKSLVESARVWAEIGDFKKAIQLARNALRYAQRMNSSPVLSQIYKNLARYYDRLGDTENALAFFKLYTLENERQFNLEMARRIAELESEFEFEKQKQEIEILRRENEIELLKSNRRALLSIGLAVGGGIALLFLLLLFNQYRLKSKANKLLQEQKQNIELQKEEIESQRDDILKKNELLQGVNLQITDSIEYARQIQNSLLPDKFEIRKIFPHSFVFYQPKDIVSGDFYWYAEVEDGILLAVADCTGHGVPGAFMTVLGKSLLDQIVYEGNITTPNLIINLLDQKLRQNMKQIEGKTKTNDGMDLGLCLIDKKKREIKFAGSKIPLYLVQQGELKEVKADRVPVGSSFLDDKYFNLYDVKFEAGDVLYLASDGFQDQFGFNTNKKYLKSQFKNLLKQISGLPIAMQEERLKSEWSNWKGNLEQTDDLLIMGIRLL